MSSAGAQWDVLQQRFYLTDFRMMNAAVFMENRIIYTKVETNEKFCSNFIISIDFEGGKIMMNR